MPDLSGVEAKVSDDYGVTDTIVQPSMSVLSRQELMSSYGIDCGDGVDFGEAWNIGSEYMRYLTLKNLLSQTVKLTYTLPAGYCFHMDFPESVTLAPGSSKSIPVIFRPVKHVNYLDYITVNCT